MPVKLNKNAIERHEVIEIHFPVARSAVRAACCDISIRPLCERTGDGSLENTLVRAAAEEGEGG